VEADRQGGQGPPRAVAPGRRRRRRSCNGAQAFALKPFYKNGDSLVIAQREFRRGFGIHCNRAVPSAHAIKTWVRNFEATGSTLKKKGGSVKTVRTPENIAVMREVIERSSHRCARRHSVVTWAV
jgi:transposase